MGGGILVPKKTVSSISPLPRDLFQVKLVWKANLQPIVLIDNEHRALVRYVVFLSPGLRW